MPPKFKKSLEMSDRRSATEPERQGLLESQSDDDDFFLRGPAVHTNNLVKDSKLSKVQGQVTEVVGVMKNNITKVMERGDKLEDLQDKSDDLAFQADYFRSTARGLKTQMWWRECKMRLLLAVVIIVILVIIFVPIIVQHMK